MNWITDLLKEIPLSAVLREKITTIEAKYAALDTENAILKDDNRELKAHIMELERQVTNLKKEIENLTHVGDDLEEIEVELLRALTSPGVQSAEDLVGVAGSNLTRIEYHLHRLAEAKYVYRAGGGDRLYYSLTQKGREALLKRKLI